jgi:hypothetical protein
MLFFLYTVTWRFDRLCTGVLVKHKHIYVNGLDLFQGLLAWRVKSETGFDCARLLWFSVFESMYECLHLFVVNWWLKQRMRTAELDLRLKRTGHPFFVLVMHSWVILCPSFKAPLVRQVNSEVACQIPVKTTPYGEKYPITTQRQ